MRRIEEIRSTLEDGEEGAAEIRAAARLLEQSVAVDRVFSAVADGKFPDALIAASQGSEAPEERAWLTLAAAGPRRARQVLAWRASQLLDPAQVAALARKRESVRALTLKLLALAANEPEAAASWRLLAHLRGPELRAMVRSRPALAAAYHRARPRRGRVTTEGSPPALCAC